MLVMSYIPEELKAVAFTRPLHEWSSVPDEEIPVPRHLIAEEAFYRWINRENRHGNDQADWYASEKDWRTILRQFIASLDEHPDDFTGPAEGTQENDLSLPKIMDESMETHRKNFGRLSGRFAHLKSPGLGGSIQEGEIDMMKRNQQFTRDRYGNIWAHTPPVRSELSAEQVDKLFPGCATIAVHIESDRVFAGGNSEDELEQGFDAKELNPTDFQLEPASFIGLHLPSVSGPDSSIN